MQYPVYPPAVFKRNPRVDHSFSVELAQAQIWKDYGKFFLPIGRGGSGSNVD